MTGKTDFVFLYEQLGLSPGCSQAELRRAYRRRVAELHPDRHADASAAARLQELNSAYAEATLFHRRHGRLPGATRRGAARGARLAPLPFAPIAPALPRASFLRRVVLGLLVLAALLWLLWANAAGMR